MNTVAEHAPWLSELEALVGDECDADAEAFAIDGAAPSAVVCPENAESVRDVVEVANAHHLQVVPCGGMTSQGAGARVESIDIALSTRKLNRKVFYDPGDLTVGFEAGVTIAEAQRTLGEHGQYLPLDPALPEKATIGGVLAANAQGPMKAGFGGAREFCIGVEFVTGEGRIAKGGGRVVKNVAGFDLMKLMIGSHGTLGMITSANFKVFPLPAQTRTFVKEFGAVQATMEYCRKVMASPLAPMCFEILSPQAQEYVPEHEARDPDHYHPAEPVRLRNSWVVAVKAGGSEAVLRRYRQELDAAHELEGRDEADFWARVADFAPRVLARHQNAMMMEISAPIRQIQLALEAAQASAVEHNMMASVIGRAPAGSLVAAMVPLAVDPPSAMAFANVASALRGRLPAGTSAVVTRCPLESKGRFDLWGDTPTDRELMRKVRMAMDPGGVMNRGRFLV